MQTHNKLENVAGQFVDVYGLFGFCIVTNNDNSDLDLKLYQHDIDLICFDITNQNIAICHNLYVKSSELI